jgi:hypothetical protein
VLLLYLQPPRAEGKDVPVQSLILGLSDHDVREGLNLVWKTELRKAWDVLLEWAPVMSRLSSGVLDAQRWPAKRCSLYGVFAMAYDAELTMCLCLSPSEQTLGLLRLTSTVFLSTSKHPVLGMSGMRSSTGHNRSGRMIFGRRSCTCGAGPRAHWSTLRLSSEGWTRI